LSFTKFGEESPNLEEKVIVSGALGPTVNCAQSVYKNCRGHFQRDFQTLIC